MSLTIFTSKTKRLLLTKPVHELLTFSDVFYDTYALFPEIQIGYPIDEFSDGLSCTHHSYWVEERQAFFNFNCLFFQNKPFAFTFCESSEDGETWEDPVIEICDKQVLEVVLDAAFKAIKHYALKAV